MNETGRSVRGGISFFLALVLTSVLALDCMLIRGARVLDLELRAGRVLDFANELTLASYDRELAKHYGLLGFTGPGPQPAAAYFLEAETQALPGTCTLTQTESIPLKNPRELNSQISSYMKLIYPQILLEELLLRCGVLSGGGEPNEEDAPGMPDEGGGERSVYVNSGLSELMEKLNSAELSSAMVTLGVYLAEQSGTLGGRILAAFFEKQADDVSEGEEYHPVLSPEEQVQGDEYLSSLAAAVEVPIPDDSGEAASLAETASVSWQPEQLAGRLSDGLAALDFPSVGLLDRLLTVEYVLELFTTWRDQRAGKSLMSARETLRGEALDSFMHASELEAEYMLSGLPSETGRKLMAGGMLSGLRLLLRACGLMQNETEMQKISTAAGIISVGLSVVTAGQIIIEPESLKYIILLIKAQTEALQDLNRLLDGDTVELLPYVQGIDIQFDYRDFLRLFLLTVDPDMLLGRISSVIESNLGREFYTSVSAVLQYSGNSPLIRDFTLIRMSSYGD